MAAVHAGSAHDMPRLKTKQWSVAILSTLAFTVCFAIWMMFAVIGIPIKKMLDLNATQFGLLTATPVLTGSLIRAFGKASVFKYISDDYPANIGTISGIVGLAGGLGGFILPIMFGALLDLTGVRSTAFMLMYGVVWVSLIWMYWTEVRRTELMGPHAQAFSLKG
jgi:NNP family nitrate/nitrite transporter-like MFS transporter